MYLTYDEYGRPQQDSYSEFAAKLFDGLGELGKKKKKGIFGKLKKKSLLRKLIKKGKGKKKRSSGGGEEAAMVEQGAQPVTMTEYYDPDTGQTYSGDEYYDPEAGAGGEGESIDERIEASPQAEFVESGGSEAAEGVDGYLTAWGDGVGAIRRVAQSRRVHPSSRRRYAAGRQGGGGIYRKARAYPPAYQLSGYIVTKVSPGQRIYENDYAQNALGGIGQMMGGLSPQAEYVRSVRSLGGVSNWNFNVEQNPSYWKHNAMQALKIANIEYRTFTQQIEGRTGNPEGEAKLKQGWLNLTLSATKVINSEPSWSTLAKAKLNVFMRDAYGGVVSAWKDINSWAIRNAGSTLEKYHAARVRGMKLRQDLKAAQAAGKVTSAQANAQAQKIASAEAKLESAAQVFRTASGGASLDDIAQKEHGKYPQLGAWPLVVAGLAVAAAICAGIVLLAVGIMNGIPSLMGSIGDSMETLMIVAGIVAFGVFVLPKIMKG